jgi:hypothetical protein
MVVTVHISVVGGYRLLEEHDEAYYKSFNPPTRLCGVTALKTSRSNLLCFHFVMFMCPSSSKVALVRI